MIGDVNQSGAVTVEDFRLVQANSGQDVTSSTFQYDVTHKGLINSSDIGDTQWLAGQGDSLYPPSDCDVSLIAATVLGHELGHSVLGYEDVTSGITAPNNIRDVENPIRSALGIPARETYHGSPFVKP